MQSHNLHIFGLDLAFKAKVNTALLEQVCVFLEERFSKLEQTGGHVSKEKLLAYLALALAADHLHLETEHKKMAEQIEELLVKIEKTTE